MNTYQKAQVVKFSMYGFLKNLRFFEAFLIIYMLSHDMNLFKIGILFAIREAIIYIFEIPSGVLADRFGKKNELVLCFLFYIVSFLFFYIGGDYYIFIIAMILYGFGEAFRSGTHKAMIMDFLDFEDIDISKGRIYGKTRAYSLLGSMISSIIAIFLYLYFKGIRLLFIIAIIPYLIDLLLILSYPSYMNERRDETFSFKPFVIKNLQGIKFAFTDKTSRFLLISSSSYGAWFKVIKDYIQPIVALGVYIIYSNSEFELETSQVIYLGIVYAFIYLISSIGSRNSYRIKKHISDSVITTFIWIPSALIALLIGFLHSSLIAVTILFVLLYLLLNIRKPLMIELIGEHIDADKRATLLSVESQITSILIIVFAPLLGFISDRFGIDIMFISLGTAILVIQSVVALRKGPWHQKW